MAKIVYRNVRHPLTEDRSEWLKHHFVTEITVHTEDVPYGDDPVNAVMKVLTGLDGEVVAVEAGGPEPVMIALAEGLAEQGIPLIRQVYKRDFATGRVIVTGKDERGRDILAFDRYEQVAVEVRKALVGLPLEPR